MCSFRLSRGSRGHGVPYAMTAPPSLRALRPAAARPADGAALDLARRAGESFRRAVEAQRAGDWARYGEELSRLEEVLRQLQVVLGAGGAGGSNAARLRRDP